MLPSKEFKTYPESTEDAILLTKQFISSQELSQPPLLILPVAMLPKLASPQTLQPLARNVLSQREVSEFLRTARIIEAHPWLLSSAANYLRELVSRNQQKDWLPPPDLKFVHCQQQTFVMKLPPPPDWQNFAPLPPRTIQVSVSGPALRGQAKPKAALAPKAKGKTGAKSQPAPKAKGKANAKPQPVPAPKAGAKKRAKPEGQELGCSKCRFAENGCARCRAIRDRERGRG